MEDLENWLKRIHEEAAQRRRNYKGPYCCLTMDAELARENPLLYYNFKYREYGVKIYKTNRYMLLYYCVCCGSKLPSSLRIEWAETLKKEYKLSDPMNHDKKKIPKEFLTDEWWKAYPANHLEQFNIEARYCCLDMYKELLEDESLLFYSPKYREHGIKIPQSTAIIEIDYCIFCGKELPKSVGDEWLNILEQEYGLESPYEEDKKKIPKEFLTDEWWKKRGL